MQRKTFGPLPRMLGEKGLTYTFSVTVRTRETSVLCGFSVSNAAARLEGMSYSKADGHFTFSGIRNQPPSVGWLAMNHPGSFPNIVAKAKLRKNSCR